MYSSSSKRSCQDDSLSVQPFVRSRAMGHSGALVSLDFAGPDTHIGVLAVQIYYHDRVGVVFTSVSEAQGTIRNRPIKVSRCYLPLQVSRPLLPSRFCGHLTTGSQFEYLLSSSLLLLKSQSSLNWLHMASMSCIKAHVMEETAQHITVTPTE